jgi:hypothetical protein
VQPPGDPQHTGTETPMPPQDQLSPKEMVTCKRGHIHEKQSPHKGCPVCWKDARKNWVKTHPEEYKAIHKRYLERNKDVVTARRKKYCEEHAEERKKSFQEWFLKNRESNNKKCRDRARSNRDQHCWKSMIYRCTNPKAKQYADYGGRGITVCERWSGENGFQNFMADMGPRPSPKHETDRRNNDLGYCPENCKWATRKEQARNKRSNRLITYDGRTQCITDWAAECGIPDAVFRGRVTTLGWSMDRAMNEKVVRNDKSHWELCQRAVKWLRSTVKCSTVFTELRSASDETPDAIGWKYGRSILVECKVRRSDFFQDAKKVSRRSPHLGMGQQRYFLVPEGLVQPDEVPDGWGLLYASGRIIIAKKPVSFNQWNMRGEIALLTSALRRTQLRIDKPLHEWLKWDSSENLIAPN